MIYALPLLKLSLQPYKTNTNNGQQPKINKTSFKEGNETIKKLTNNEMQFFLIEDNQLLVS